MMQQIATLQTDIAAKPTTEFGFDTGTALTSGDNANIRSNGEQFGHVLRDQKQAQASEKPAPEQPTKSVEKKPSDDQPQPVEPKETRSDKTKTEKPESVEKKEADSTNTGLVKDTESSNSARKDESVVSEENAKQDIVIQEETKKIPSQDVVLELESLVVESSEDVSWVDFVEKIKNLNENASKTVNPEQESDWDGEIAEMVIAKDDSILVSANPVETKPVEITLPVSVADKLGDDEAAKAQIEAWLAQLQSNGGEDTDIPNDLYVSPVEVLDTGIETKKELVVEPDIVADEEQDVLLPIPEVSESTQQLVSELLSQPVETEIAPVVVDDETTAVILDEAPAVVLNPIAVDPKQTNESNNVTVKVDVSEKAIVNTVTQESKQQAIAETLAQQLQTVVKQPVTEAQQNAFVAALQAGVNEYQAQVKQGHEPGISLKALITDALEAAQIPVEKSEINPLVRVTEQTLQAAVLTDALNAARLDADLQNRVSLGQVEVASDATVQSELRPNTQATILDKPANILKPEGQTQFAEKIRWMVNARNSFAEIRLDPPDLGSVQVKVAMNGEAAAVNFVVQSPQARDALDQALPRLREMLNQQGIELGQSSVQQDQQQQQDEQQQQSFADNEGDDAMEEIAGDVIEQRVVNGTAGGIDYYA